MVFIRLFSLYAATSILLAQPALQGMESAQATTTKETIEYINSAYLITKIAALLVDATEESSSEESTDDTESLNASSILHRAVITSIIDSIRFGHIPLTINGKTVLIKEVCNPHSLKELVHTVHRDYYESSGAHSSIFYLKKLNAALEWNTLKSSIPSDAYEDLFSLLQKTRSSDLETEEYKLLVQRVAQILGCSLEKEISMSALDELCNDLAESKKTSLGKIFRCFSNSSSNQQTKPLRMLGGLLCFLEDLKKNPGATYQKILQIYTSLSSHNQSIRF